MTNPVIVGKGKGAHIDWSTGVTPEKEVPATRATWRTTGHVPADSLR